MVEVPVVVGLVVEGVADVATVELAGLTEELELDAPEHSLGVVM